MLSEKNYIEISDFFGSSVGIAHAIYKGVKEVGSKEDIRDYNDERYINGVILRCIERGEYQTLQRELYRIRREFGKRKVKEVTIYKKAWYKIVNGHDKTNNTKSGALLKEE